MSRRPKQDESERHSSAAEKGSGNDAYPAAGRSLALLSLLAPVSIAVLSINPIFRIDLSFRIVIVLELELELGFLPAGVRP
jgi:hypothetical protein